MIYLNCLLEKELITQERYDTLSAIIETLPASNSDILKFLAAGIVAEGNPAIVTVLSFGAKGDGVTDDTTAFTAALNADIPVLIPSGSYYLTESFPAPNKFFSFGGLTWTHPSNFRAFMFLNIGGNLLSRIASSMTTNREELQIYASASGAYGLNSRGAGIHLYGNGDSQHAGNFVVMTGQDDDGDARIIASGGSSDPTSAGHRTNTDTRVTIGNGIFNFVDDGDDTGMLNLKSADGRPAILFTDCLTGSMAVVAGEDISIGHWNGFVYTERMKIKSDGIINLANSAFPLFANDAAADAVLSSGDLYSTTAGGRSVFRKP